MVDLSPISPAIALTIGLLAVILADLVTRGKRPGIPIAIAIASLAISVVLAWTLKDQDKTVLGVLRADRFGNVFTLICCITGLITVIATTRGEVFRSPGGEYLTLILAAVIGMSLLSMSVDLLTLYLAFETVSIPSYVLVGMRRADVRANEASLKYVLFGAVSSGVMLYGLSMFVGLAGTTTLDGLTVAIQNGAASQPIFWVASLMVLAGFAFKISAVPFHFWAPDVYGGAPAAIGGFLAVASKAAGFAALVRVVAATIPNVLPAENPVTAFLPDGNFLMKAIAVCAILTMTFGNLAALGQREIKRLLAWSSIAHAGYILLAISVWGKDAIAGLVLYLVAYLLMNLAAFFVAGIAIRETGSGQISAFKGLAKRNVWLAASLTLCLFSLTGLPPFFGFIGKLQIFTAIFEKGYAWLGVIGLVNGVISLYYYARVAMAMWPFDSDERAPQHAPIRLALIDGVLCAVLALPLLGFFIWWGPLWEWAQSVVPALAGGMSP